MSHSIVECPKCGGEVVQQAMLIAEAPVGWKNFSKTGIRSRSVKLVLVERHKYIYCSECGFDLKP